MTFIPVVDLNLEIPAGRIEGKTCVNKFGRAPQGVQNGTLSDIWDRADATPTQQIWTAPTQARIHQIKSTSASDDGDPVGVGARTLRVFGLTSWSAAEVNEDITMNGTSNVATSNSYVIIHRMQVLTKGATASNVGIITATADTDGTITAQINAGEGQTQMAIYGIPSTQTAYLTCYHGSVQSVASGKEIIMKLVTNPEPDAELTNFIVKDTFGIGGSGTTAYKQSFRPYKKIVGPAIIKIQGIGDADDMDVSGGFDIILEDN